MDNNGISETSIAIQQAHSAATKARDAFEVDNANAMALAAEFDETFDNLIATLAPALAAALRTRRESYYRCIIAERQRASADGEESRESEIVVKRYARDFRAPLSQLEPLSEYSLSVPNDPDPAESLVPRPGYLNAGAEPVPMRKNRP